MTTSPKLTSVYGLVIVDECHHVPAVTFERAVREIPVRRWLGLTATPYRRDGLQALMTMHCGPVRHKMAPSQGSALRALDLVVHETSHQAAHDGDHIQTIYRGLVEDTERNRSICADIAAAVEAGRNCLVLTRWTEHLDVIVELLAGHCPPLDTLFLAFPIKFKGNVVQYVGRVLRPTETKTRVEVHDYVDVLVPVLARQHHERRAAYAALGFDVPRIPPDRVRNGRTRGVPPSQGARPGG